MHPPVELEPEEELLVLPFARTFELISPSVAMAARPLTDLWMKSRRFMVALMGCGYVPRENANFLISACTLHNCTFF
jgi:hypothetical protein